MRRWIRSLWVIVAGVACACLAAAAAAAEWTRVDSATVRMSGTIDAEDPYRFDKIIDSRTTTLVVRSAGGDVMGGIPLGERVRARGLHVVVDGYCASSCAAYLFVAAPRKTVREYSWVGWHGGITAHYDAALAEAERIYAAGGRDAPTRTEVDAFIAAMKDGLQRERDLYRTLGVSLRLLSRAAEGRTEGYIWLADRKSLEAYGVTGIESMWYPETPEEQRALPMPAGGVVLALPTDKLR